MPKQFIPEPQAEWLEVWQAFGRAENACCQLGKEKRIHFLTLLDNLREALKMFDRKLLRQQHASSPIPSP